MTNDKYQYRVKVGDFVEYKNTYYVVISKEFEIGGNSLSVGIVKFGGAGIFKKVKWFSDNHINKLRLVTQTELDHNF